VQELLYFDPDILILRDLAPLWDLLDRHAIVLTPHVTTPVEDDAKPGEVEILLAGAYNLGFLGLSLAPTTLRFLAWWAKRLYDGCRMAQRREMHVDQRWIDLVPGLFDGVHILRDPGYNVAYWNLHGRAIAFRGGDVLANGQPCYFFHFSGLDLDNLAAVSRYQNRFTLRSLGDTARLYEQFKGMLLANGHEKTSRWAYAFGRFSNGVRIPDAARTLYHSLGDARARFGDPFQAGSPRSFYAWIQEDVPGGPGAAGPVSRLWYKIYQDSPELQRRFPDVLGRHRGAFVHWVAKHGRKKYEVDPQLIPAPPGPAAGRLARRALPFPARLYMGLVDPVEATLTPALRRTVGRSPRLWARLKALRARVQGGAAWPAAEPVEMDVAPGEAGLRPDASFGVNVAGYFQSERSVGEAARATVRALRAASIPHELNNVVDPGAANADSSLTLFSPENPYGANLVHVNADQVAVFARQRGDGYFRGRFNVGFWFWELSSFPSEWHSSFRYFDEIWVASSHVLDAIARVSPVPVVRMPLALSPELQDGAALDRAGLGLAADTWVFLCMYDADSVVDRKNPFALIEAFRRAFGDSREAALVLKCHAGRRPGAGGLAAATSGMANVKVMDCVLPRAALNALLAMSDCYVSLHRSEGFGLPIAEAMLMGKPVIVTAYSGNMDFTTPANSYLVKYRLVEIDRDHGPYRKGGVWADPDIEHAAALLRQVYEHREAAQGVARLGQHDVLRLFSPATVGAQIRDRLARVAFAAP
jgi:glycosyltransferase involved in cell wall biosynthesis